MEKIILTTSKHTCMDLCKKAIKRLGWTIDNVKGDVIKTSTGFSLKSWGETLTIFLEDVGNNKIKLIIESVPKAQIIDWGKSPENEKMFVITLNELLEERR